MKKILVITYEFPPVIGGIGRYIYNLSYGLSLNNCHVTVLTNCNAPTECNNVELISLLGRGKIRDLLTIYKLFVSGKYDYCILAHTRSFIVGGFLSFLPVFKKKFLLPLYGSELLKIRKLSFFSIGARLIINRSFKLFPISNFTYSLLDNKEKVKATIIYPALQGRWFDMNQKNRTPSPVKTFGSLSRLASRKGHDIILKVFSELSKDFNFRYLIGGIGPEEEKLKKLVKIFKLEDKVIFLGKVSERDLIDFYDSLDVYIMLNRIEDGDVEGFGYSFVEAGARCTPSIGGSNGGAVEVIPPNGGVLVNIRDLSQVKHAIISYMNDTALIQEHGNNSNLFCKENFSLEKMVNSYLDEM